MAGGIGSVKFLPGDEPGKRRAEWSGHDGTRPVAISDHLEGARAALDAGDVKSASVYVRRAITQNRHAGRDAGMPLEAPGQKDLYEADHWLEKCAEDIMLEARVTHPAYVSNAERAIARAIEVQ